LDFFPLTGLNFAITAIVASGTEGKTLAHVRGSVFPTLNHDREGVS